MPRNCVLAGALKSGAEDVFPGDIAQDWLARWRDNPKALERELARAGADEEERGVANELALARAALERARGELCGGRGRLTELDAQQPQMHAERDARRTALAAARTAAQAAQLAARDLLVRSESVRTAENSLTVGLNRMSEQRAQLAARCTELERELASGDAPIVALEERLAEALAQRLAVDAQLAGARTALEAAEAELRTLDERRAACEQRVSAPRRARLMRARRWRRRAWPHPRRACDAKPLPSSSRPPILCSRRSRRGLRRMRACRPGRRRSPRRARMWNGSDR